MGSPVSVVVAKIVMQSIDERALATYYQRTLPFSFRYVDDTITALQQDHIEIFHNHINEQNWDIICDSANALLNENDYQQHVLHKNNYKPDFEKLNTYKNNELNEINIPTYSYSNNNLHKRYTSEIISPILRPYNIRVAQTRHNLRHILTNVKDKEQPYERQLGAVYKSNLCRMPDHLYW